MTQASTAQDVIGQARTDATLAGVSIEDLSSVLAAVTVALAMRTNSTPRNVLETMWKVHLNDETWTAIRERYLDTR